MRRTLSPRRAYLLIGGLALAAVVALGGCTDPKIAQETAEVSGFTDVQVTGYEAWGCGKDDAYHTGFTARGVNGACIHGVVCSNVFKGATLRILGPSNACPYKPETR